MDTNNAAAAIDRLSRQLAHLTIAANMTGCGRCSATGTYGHHGKCYSCKGSRRVLRPAVAKIARTIRAQRDAARKQAVDAARVDADSTLAGYGLTINDVRFVMANGVEAAWRLVNRYEERMAMTQDDVDLMSTMSGGPF